MTKESSINPALAERIEQLFPALENRYLTLAQMLQNAVLQASDPHAPTVIHDWDLLLAERDLLSVLAVIIGRDGDIVAFD